MKRSIGIDVTENKISVVQLYHGRDKLSLERAYTHLIQSSTPPKGDSPVDLPAVVKAAMSEGKFDKGATVVAAMPSGRVFFQGFKTDLTTNEDVRRLLKFEIEDDFPIPFDDLVADICSYRELNEHEREYLVGAVSRSELRDQVKMLTEAGLECSTVSADACGLHTVAALNHDLSHNTPSFVLYVDVCRIILAVSDNNRLVCVRYFNYSDSLESTASMLAREIELTSRAIFNPYPPMPLKILLSGSDKLVHNICEEFGRETSYEVVVLNPCSRISCPRTQQVDGELSIALGLALIGANKNSEVLDFLAADISKRDQIAKIKRSAVAFGLLLLTIIALLVGNLFMQLNALEDEQQRIQQGIREVFVQTLPEEERIVNELAQMTERYEALKAEYDILATAMGDRASPLRVLQRLSEKLTSDQNATVSHISVTAESVQLAGTSDSFKSVDNLIDILRHISEFHLVELQNINVDPKTGRVPFSLLITTGSN